MRKGLLPIIGLLSVCLSSRILAFEDVNGGAAREVMSLYRDEIQQAVVKMKWRGERLTDDTLYAAALTGLSWETCWGKEPLFSLCWGDLKKVTQKRKKDVYEQNRKEVESYFASKQYTRAVSSAEDHFSLEEIQCDPILKQAVGTSLQLSGQPARALNVFAAPVDIEPSEDAEESNRLFREQAFVAARQAGETRSAIAFALSLILEPGSDPPAPNPVAMSYLEEKGIDLDRVMIGILQAPDRLRGLPQYIYPAADLLAIRATPRLLPFFMHLAQSDDIHLRSRSILGLGLLAYRSRSGDAPGWHDGLVQASLREYGLSSGERKLIEREIKEAAQSDRYRLRTAAAVALSLSGEESAVPMLQKMSKDKAYLLFEPSGWKSKNGPKRILFPVRMAACAGLARFGISNQPGGGELAGKALDAAKRGGQNVTDDNRGIRKEMRSPLMVLPIDIPIAVALLQN